MPTKARMMKILIVTAVAVFVFRSAERMAVAQTSAGARTASAPVAKAGSISEARASLTAAAFALGMIRPSAVGRGSPRLDVVNTLELWGGGTPFSEYHVSLAYNPPGMRVESTNPKGKPEHSFEVVAGKYAWNESELGGGLQPGTGTATPMPAASKERLLWLWTLPYGVVKAGLAAGDNAKVSTENGATVITFPLAGELAGVTVKATLDAKNLVVKVETRTDKPGMDNLATETEYSDYADRAEVLTDVLVPGRMVRKRAGKTLLDVQVKTADTNNPYVVIPVPDNVAGGMGR